MGQNRGHLDDILQATPGFLQNVFQVSIDLASLSLKISFPDQLSLDVPGYLTSDVQCLFHLRNMRISPVFRFMNAFQW
jgi:hypothetical protein